MIELADQAVALRQRVPQRVDQPDVLQGGRRGAGDDLQLGQLVRRELAHLGPVGSDGGDGLQRSHRGHHQAAHEGRAVGVVGDAVVGVDVRHDRGLAIQHRPAGDAVLDREAAALPQRLDRVLVDIAALIAIAHDHGDAVGPARAAGGRADDRGDLLGRARQRKLLDGLDQGDQRAPVGDRRLGGHDIQKSGHPSRSLGIDEASAGFR